MFLHAPISCLKANSPILQSIMIMYTSPGSPAKYLSSCNHLKKKKNHYILSSQLRADQMPGPPREGQLIDLCSPNSNFWLP